MLLALCAALIGLSAPAAAAGECPSFVYSIATYEPATISNLTWDSACRTRSLRDVDPALAAACACPPATDAKDRQTAACTATPVNQTATLWQPVTRFVIVPQHRNPSGACVPEWNLAQPPVAAGSNRTAELQAPRPIAPHAAPVRALSPPAPRPAAVPAHVFAAPPSVHTGRPGRPSPPYK